MATLQAADIADLVTSTLRDLGRNKFQQIAQTLQEYEMMGKWLKKDKVAFDSGYGISRTLMNKLAGSAKHVGLYEEDEVNVADLLTQLVVPWRQVTCHWAYEYRETLYNRGKALIVNIIKPRRAGAMIDMAEELEAKAWASPSVSNKVDPYGVPYWVVKNATTGFNGGHPTGHTSVGGIDVAVVTTFKNYTAQYVNVSKADLIKKMRTGHRKVRWMSPVSVADFRGGRGDRYRIYCNEPTIQAFETVGEGQNENLGKDIASLDDQIVFRKIPIIWVPFLDDDTTNPVYMLDHSTFFPVCLKGDYLRESAVKEAPKQHNVFQVFVDLSYNFCCVDRRRNAVFATA